MVGALDFMKFNALGSGLGVDDMGGGGDLVSAGVPMGAPMGSMSMFGNGAVAGGGIYDGLGSFASLGDGGPQIGGGGMSGMQIANAGLAGLQTLGALWGAWQQNKMAKKQFKFTKDVTNTNLANQIKSYNTALYDRARSRAVMESQSDAVRDAYVANNSLSRSATGTHSTDAYTHNYAGGATNPTAASLSSYSSLAGSTSRPAASSTSTPRDDETNG